MKKNGKYLLTDESTQIIIELRGKNLAKMKGKRVQVTGAILAGEAAAAGASVVLSVSLVTTVAAAAAAGTAAAGAGAASGAALSAGTIAVIGGCRGRRYGWRPLCRRCDWRRRDSHQPLSITPIAPALTGAGRPAVRVIRARSR